MPIPEWTKEILASAERKADASVPVPATELDEPLLDEPREEPQTDVPEDIQDEIRALAAQEAETLALGAPPEEPPEEVLDEEPLEDAAIEAEGFEAETETPDEGAPEPPKPAPSPRRFEFVLKAAPLKAFLAQVAHLADEAKVVATRDAWRAVVVDPAHVALIDVTLPDVEGLERRDGRFVAIDEPIEFGADVKKLLDLVRKVPKDELVRVTADLPNGEYKEELIFAFGAMRRTMAAIDLTDMADPRIPILNLPASVEVSATSLLEALKACEDMTDHVRLTVTRDGLNVSAEGDVDKVSIDLRDGDAVHAATEDAYTSLFPLDYLLAFVKVVKDVGRLVVRLGTDYPIRVDWDGATRGTFLAAPRNEAD